MSRACDCAVAVGGGDELPEQRVRVQRRDLYSGWNWQARNQGWSAYSTISTNLPSGERPVTRSPPSFSCGRNSWFTS